MPAPVSCDPRPSWRSTKHGGPGGVHEGVRAPGARRAASRTKRDRAGIPPSEGDSVRCVGETATGPGPRRTGRQAARQIDNSRGGKADLSKSLAGDLQPYSYVRALERYLHVRARLRMTFHRPFYHANGMLFCSTNCCMLPCIWGRDTCRMQGRIGAVIPRPVGSLGAMHMANDIHAMPPHLQCAMHLAKRLANGQLSEVRPFARCYTHRISPAMACGVICVMLHTWRSTYPKLGHDQLLQDGVPFVSCYPHGVSPELIYPNLVRGTHIQSRRGDGSSHLPFRHWHWHCGCPWVRRAKRLWTCPGRRARTGRGPDAGRTIAFEETDADRTRTGRGRGRFSLPAALGGGGARPPAFEPLFRMYPVARDWVVTYSEF
eukprot:gene7898-biopygen22577